ncbi:MAG TPA: hypothetical protein RMH85_22010 [Polyangiaceae bacterium LLY-WYZ-15_(1-7)]|nr:hypothetical protein [Polyangiaceae bacterium LLY-WYZ-15_(1-7)]HJL03231.1 hypothetical protein [Polyangiaceae bacterium LLY-WYZ-15_(1-7)]HJL11167.1 hypothetical protein [Polyangiaceae bacterium LLY-WYZ-15_(1-7)]HJL27477.1 hypothetical protein [Polyangiaceae bacterium LLY-WYZ-15_(1-7)]HJL36923.1 hypothetical protein [Polyangiaceae bacterium LLY-WYZ-15_(1-7)]
MRLTSWLALLALVACGDPGGGGSGGDGPEATAGSEAAGEEDPAGDAGSEERAEPTAAEEAPPLDGLHEGDTLTYLVHLTQEERQVRMVIDQIHRQGTATAVKLRPVGTPLGEDPVYVGWLVATESEFVGLEPHVSLSQPGFVPVDAGGTLVTEAEGNVAWRVPSRWYDLSERAFERDPVAGWRFHDLQPSIEGPVRGERCVRLDRRDGDIETEMRICRNVGIFEIVRRGAEPSEQSWRLVDLGQLPDELRPSLDVAEDVGEDTM